MVDNYKDNTPKVWGKHYWFMMRNIAYHYPDKPMQVEKDQVCIFFTSLKWLLPCVSCANNYDRLLRKYPIKNSCNNSKDLQNWVEKIYEETKKDVESKNRSNTLNEEREKLIERRRQIMRNNARKKILAQKK